MAFNKETAADRAKEDLAARLSVEKSEIDEKSVRDTEFPDMSLGAPSDGEMSAQMISYGWTIDLAAGGKGYEYRADKYQIRLVNYNGRNHVIV